MRTPDSEGTGISIKLIGVQSNRSAIGARIHLRILENGSPRSIYKHVNSGGTFGCNPLRQTIGLGNSEQVELLHVFWPTTGLTQTFERVACNQFIQIVEGAQELHRAQTEKADTRRAPLSIDKHHVFRKYLVGSKQRLVMPPSVRRATKTNSLASLLLPISPQIRTVRTLARHAGLKDKSTTLPFSLICKCIDYVDQVKNLG